MFNLSGPCSIISVSYWTDFSGGWRWKNRDVNLWCEFMLFHQGTEPGEAPLKQLHNTDSLSGNNAFTSFAPLRRFTGYVLLWRDFSVLKPVTPDDSLCCHKLLKVSLPFSVNTDFVPQRYYGWEHSSLFFPLLAHFAKYCLLKHFQCKIFPFTLSFLFPMFVVVLQQQYNYCKAT